MSQARWIEHVREPFMRRTAKSSILMGEAIKEGIKAILVMISKENSLSSLVSYLPLHRE